jgi:hypothetical protein
MESLSPSAEFLNTRWFLTAERSTCQQFSIIESLLDLHVAVSEGLRWICQVASATVPRRSIELERTQRLPVWSLHLPSQSSFHLCTAVVPAGRVTYYIDEHGVDCGSKSTRFEPLLDYRTELDERFRAWPMSVAVSVAECHRDMFATAFQHSGFLARLGSFVVSLATSFPGLGRRTNPSERVVNLPPQRRSPAWRKAQGQSNKPIT